MFRPRKLTFKDVLVRDGVNVDAGPADILLIMLNSLRSGDEKSAKGAFATHSNGMIEGDSFKIHINDNCAGNLNIVEIRSLGPGKVYGWSANVLDKNGDWNKIKCWSECDTIYKKDAKNV